MTGEAKTVGLSVDVILILLLITLGLLLWTVSTYLDHWARQSEIIDAAGRRRRPLVGLVTRLDAAVRRTRWGTGTEAKLAGAGLGWSVAGSLGRVTALTALAFAVTFPVLGKVASVVIAVAVPLAFSRWLEHRRLKRIEEFIAQLPELARLLANAASAGLSVRRGLEMASREMAEPAVTELSTVVGQLEVGRTLDLALSDLSTRLPSRELSVLIQTIVIQARTGGALSTALGAIATTLDDRKELRREIRTVVMGSVFGGYAVLGIAVASVLMLNLLAPGVLDQMASSLIGQLVLIVAGILFGAGFWLMRVFTKVDV